MTTAIAKITHLTHSAIIQHNEIVLERSGEIADILEKNNYLPGLAHEERAKVLQRIIGYTVGWSNGLADLRHEGWNDGK